MNYQESIDYLNQFVNFERLKAPSYGMFHLLEIKRLLHKLNNPQDKIKSIHIVGTVGKGDRTFIIESILRSAGYNVGLYISPHLMDIRERIQINRKLISKPDFANYITFLKSIINKKKLNLTYFEVLTALAFLYFKDNKVDVAVIEAGLGGRLDATNVISNPLVIVICKIGYDHMQILGPSLIHIANEKVAVIKKGSKVVTFQQDKKVQRIIQKKCDEEKAQLYCVEEMYETKYCNGMMDVYPNKDTVPGQYFHVLNRKSKKIFYSKLYIPLLGEHQLKNVIASLCVIDILKKKKFKISKRNVQSGLRNLDISGRIEIIKTEPFFIVDSAHNVDSITVLINTLKSKFLYDRLILIFSIMLDKDIKTIVNLIASIADIIILVDLKSERSARPEEIVKKMEKNNIQKIAIFDDVKTAFKVAMNLARKDDLILSTGSFYLSAEIKKLTL